MKEKLVEFTLASDARMRWTFILCVFHFVANVDAYAQRIAITERQVVVVCGNGDVYCRGDNFNGRLGDGTTERRLDFVRAVDLQRVRSVAVDDYGTFAVTAEGNVYFWGELSGRRMGMPSWTPTKPQLVPLLLETVDSVVQVAPGDQHVLYLRSNGGVVVTGYNQLGVYGNGTLESLDTGYAIAHVDSVKSVHSSLVTCFAIFNDGVVKAWGSNSKQLIDSTSNKWYVEPTVVQGIQRTTSLSATWTYDVLAVVKQLTDNGEVYSLDSRKRIELPLKCIKVACAPDHSLALLEDGTVWSWDEKSAEPVRVQPLANIIDIAAGPFVSLALDSEGRLFGWGNNGFRQISSDTVGWYNSPIEMPLPCAITSVQNFPESSPRPGVHPIPCSEYLDVELAHDEIGKNIETKVLSLSGEVLYRSLGSHERVMRIQLQFIPSGAYILVVSAPATSRSVLFLKKQ